jgi:teichuronic acid biosynthesis glycosyltransferase TuaH
MIKGKVLILANTHFKSIFRVGAHHITDWFNDHSWQIDYFSSPISIFKLLDFRSLDNRLRIKGIFLAKDKNIKFQVPLCILPFHKTSYIPFLALRILLASPFNVQLNQKSYDIVIIDSPEYLPVIEKLKVGLVIYRPTDIYLEHSYEHYFLEKKFVFNNSKYRIFCMSKESYEFYSSNSNNVIGYTANGVSDKFFAECSSYHHEPILGSRRSVRMVYVGALDKRLDYLWLEKIATIPGLHIEIYGDGPELKSITKSKVLAHSYRGVVNHISLPQILSSHNFALMPFSNDGKNKSRSPMKLYEYLSAGLPVLCNFDLDVPNECFFSTPTSSLSKAELSSFKDKIFSKYDGMRKSDISKFALEHLWSIKAQSLLSEIKDHNLGFKNLK